ncbi:MAG: zinc ribbon domain-containing protein [Promethearchaeota archaeon]
MANWKEYIWAIPIVGAIIAFISMAVPAVISTSLESELMGPAPWGMEIWLIGHFEFGPSSGSISELNDIYSGVFEFPEAAFTICMVGVLIGAIITVISGVIGFRERSGKSDSRIGDYRKHITLLGGGLMVLFSLIFIIWVEADASLFSGNTIDVITDEYYYKFMPGFGIIGPIIGGVLCIASAFMGPIPEKERIEPETPKQLLVKAEPQVTAQPQVTPDSEARFCPHCGTRVPGDYCPDCGKPFQPLIAQ